MSLIKCLLNKYVFFLKLASEEVHNLMRMESVIVSTSMSTVTESREPGKAVDGMIGPVPEMCNCCSSTENSALSWWKVDMNEIYPVREIVLYGRKDGILTE